MLQQQETYLSSPLQATDHTFLQKCHYHHGNSPWYTKPKLPLPVFTVKHYAGPVTYQVHKFLNKNRDQLRPEVLDIFSQSQVCKVFSGQHREEDDQRFFLLFCRSHIFFIRCITPNPKKLSNIFDVEYVTCQLRHSGILEAIHIRKEGYSVRLPFQNFLARYSSVLAWDSPGTQSLVKFITILLFSHPSRKRYRRLKKTLVQFNTMILISRHLIQRRKHCQVTTLFSGPGVLAGAISALSRENVFWLPFQLYNARPLSLAGQYRAQANQITEALPPEVKVKDDLSLPPTINSYPFSSFIKSHFQKTDFPPPGQPLQHPLTHLEAEYQGSALEINKLILRFIGDKNLHGWQEVLLGNYIAGRGLSNVALRNEIFSQVVAQTWKNPDMEHSQRAWVLMATLLSCFAPSPALEKPLLKFVSDHGMEGYNAVCQRKILTAAQYTEVDSTFSRAYPPTQLEWTANQRRGKMVLDVHTFNEEKFSAEVESWMTGEQYAGWLLSARGCDKKSRGWSISMFTGNTWQDLLGCDFVLDLIGEMEEASNFSSPSQSAEYPITPERDRSFLQYSDLDSAHRHCNSFLQAQQMTLQAMSISQQQQQRQQSLANSRPRVSSPPRAQAPAPVSTPVPATSPKPKKHPSSQNVAPPKAPEPPAKEEEPLSSPIAPASPLPPLEPKPKKQTPKVKKEPPVVKPSGPKTRPEPSREIRNIIKMYQSRPRGIQPPGVSKPFLKKNDPKNEALAKLGMMNLPSPKSTPPPLKPKPGSASSSIKEKQLPLLSIFSPEGTPPSAPPPPPPLPSPLLPGSPGWQESTGKVAGDEGIKTQLYKLTTSVSFSYANPAWKIFLRKEVFYPKENFSHPYCLNLLCEQIMRDTFSDSCFRISREEKRKMKDLLMEFRVGNDVQSIQEDGIKKRIVLAARDNWANYFSRLFPVHGEKGSDVQILGVSHRGVRLLKVVKAAGYNSEHLKILRSYSFADVLSVEMKGSDALEFSLKTEQLILHSPKAPCIKAMVELFIQELRQDTNYVVALRSYITDDKSLLSFKKGDLIELLPMQGVEPGWQFGSTGGRCGIFPTSLVQLAAAPDYLSTSMDRHGGLQKSMKASPESRNTSREVKSQLQHCL
uniref:Myosin XVB n=1 Tax=Bubo bubo TaxID=30461 RepID=A0A8C0EC29_BUBBB